ncbi:MAG: KOW domain-containing RNA-binding protein [Tissierellia bacterium]|nr:KOW domain-containing RNA-binding protein [Tissierellia bacterium]
MENTNALTKGQVVRSIAGRDAGKVFVILEIIDDQYLYLADGKLRKLERPKKKKVKHLQITYDVIDLTGEVTNSYLRKSLLPYC